ncbi:hypothetical protein PILCRDRAFT_69854, partial [Piloderma croceum F 1598]
FSSQTGNNSLRVHLDNFHKQEYVELCNQQRWCNLLPSMRRNDTSEASIGQGTQDDLPRSTFSRKSFLTHIINFVVADDQASFNILETRIMCFPYIINICSQHVISKFTNIELANATKATPVILAPNNATRQSFDNAVSRDPIALGRNTVCVLRSSGQRRDTFDDIIKDGNDKGWLGKTGNPPVNIQLRPLQLLRDVVDHFLALPINRELADYRLTDMEWSVLEDFEVILEIPHTVQQIMSNESTPILAGTIPSFELFMTSWERLTEMHERMAPWINIGMEYATAYYGRMDCTRSYIIAMGKSCNYQLLSLLLMVMTEYRERAKVRNGAVGTTSAAPDPRPNQPLAFQSLAQRYGLGTDMNFASPNSSDDQSIDQEYQSFITAPFSAQGTNTLKFWESSQLTYPTFFDMALDFLPIQASTVPSERVFSSSAETDTKKRNRINPVLMEALQMLKFALKKACLNFTDGWITPEMIMREREPEEDLLAALLGANGEDVLDRIIQDFGDDDSDNDDDEDVSL